MVLLKTLGIIFANILFSLFLILSNICIGFYFNLLGSSTMMFMLALSSLGLIITGLFFGKHDQSIKAWHCFYYSIILDLIALIYIPATCSIDMASKFVL